MCHCGRSLSASHFPDMDDLREQHQVRCCACVDSYLFGASDCEECDKAGKDADEQTIWEDA